MANRNLFVIVLLVLGLALLPLGCKKKPEEITPEPTDDQAAEQPAQTEAIKEPPPVEVTEGFAEEKPTVEEEVEPTVAQWNEMGVLKTVYFAFDKADLTDDARRTLRANADWLKTQTKYGVAVEGHCDERGTIEYNLSLGQRRSQVIKDYLVSVGVNAARVRTVSYGEERPVDPGHNETAWAKNRRGEFVIE
jgi:peptidoglycan-associated lipoprotein